MSDLPRIWVYTFIGGCAVLLLVLGWITIFGPLFNRADYNMFNNSPQHLGAIAQQFSRDCQQLAESKDVQTTKALENDIYSASSTVDLTLVQMPDYTRACVNQAIKDVSGGE